MPIPSFCPACQTQHIFPDLLYGKVVQCKNCKKSFHAGQPEKGAQDEPPENQESVSADPAKTDPPPSTEALKPRKRRSGDDEDRPRRKNETSGIPMGLVIGGIALGSALICVIGIGIAVGVTQLWGGKKAVVRVAEKEPIVDDLPFPPNNPPLPPGNPPEKWKKNPDPNLKDPFKKINPPLPQQGPLQLGNGTELQKFGPHGVSLLSAALTPDGQRAVAGAGGTLVVWDMETGKSLHRISGLRTNAEALQMTSDGRRLFAIGRFGEWLVADLDAGTKQFHNLTNKGPERMAITPDGRQAVTQDGGVLTLLDLDKQTPIRRMPWPGGQFNKALAISPDGLRALLGAQDNTVRVFDLEKGKEIRSLPGHGNSITSVAFSADGRKAVSGSADRTLKIWDLDTGEELASCNGHASSVDHVIWTADGRKVISGGDNTMRVWDATTGKALAVCIAGRKLTGIAVSADGRRLACSDYDQYLRVWQLAD
jgi:WD40 repeat protein